MKKSVLVFAVCLFALPVLASAQTYYRPYYQQKPLPEVQKTPYFLENQTGSSLQVTLLVKFPNGVKEWWPFDIAPNSEVYAMIPFGRVEASVVYATASVPKGSKIVSKKVKSFVYDREDENHRVQR